MHCLALPSRRFAPPCRALPSPCLATPCSASAVLCIAMPPPRPARHRLALTCRRRSQRPPLRLRCSLPCPRAASPSASRPCRRSALPRLAKPLRRDAPLRETCPCLAAAAPCFASPSPCQAWLVAALPSPRAASLCRRCAPRVLALPSRRLAEHGSSQLRLAVAPPSAPRVAAAWRCASKPSLVKATQGLRPATPCHAIARLWSALPPRRCATQCYAAALHCCAMPLRCTALRGRASPCRRRAALSTYCFTRHSNVPRPLFLHCPIPRLRP